MMGIYIMQNCSCIPYKENIEGVLSHAHLNEWAYI